MGGGASSKKKEAKQADRSTDKSKALEKTSSDGLSPRNGTTRMDDAAAKDGVERSFGPSLTEEITERRASSGTLQRQDSPMKPRRSRGGETDYDTATRRSSRNKRQEELREATGTTGGPTSLRIGKSQASQKWGNVVEDSLFEDIDVFDLGAKGRDETQDDLELEMVSQARTARTGAARTGNSAAPTAGRIEPGSAMQATQSGGMMPARGPGQAQHTIKSFAPPLSAKDPSQSPDEYEDEGVPLAAAAPSASSTNDKARGGGPTRAPACLGGGTWIDNSDFQRQLPMESKGGQRASGSGRSKSTSATHKSGIVSLPTIQQPLHLEAVEAMHEAIEEMGSKKRSAPAHDWDDSLGSSRNEEFVTCAGSSGRPGSRQRPGSRGRSQQHGMSHYKKNAPVAVLRQAKASPREYE